MKYLLFVILLSACADNKKVVRAYYTSGKKGLYREGTEINGVKNGEERTFYENGNLCNRHYFKNGVMVDSFYKYDSCCPDKPILTGYVQLKSKVTLLGSDGYSLIREMDEIDNGTLHGFAKEYYENGYQVKSINEYYSNILHGTSIEYYKDGNIRHIAHYKHGKHVSPDIFFDSLGNITQNERIAQ
jgi:antitoxin component YwqK of YwqJK toxin-antitoxin module